ncbi:MAG: rRNA maturation RNase YbeY [Actinomycetales bacterium]|jgi:probable rRNA maturation factor|nr:rRNA maturation RNase YbeY [Actinomycetales bacterium]
MYIELTDLTNSNADTNRIKSLADFSLRSLGIHPESELSISLVDMEEMSSLHMRWLDESGPTDVLSFPMDELKPNSSSDGPGILGDIVLCPEYAKKQAVEIGHSLQAELEVLVVHGVLHLLGFDHRENDEKTMMFSRQDEILREWRSRP